MCARTASTMLIVGLVYGGTAAPALAGDWGISFEYRSTSPHYYAVSASRACGRTAYYDGYYDDYVTYEEPVAYVGRSTPRTIVYDDYYPTTYRTTYSRSRYYAYPARRSHVAVHYSGGHRGHHYRKHTIDRHRRFTPRAAIRVYKRHGDSHFRHGRSYRDHDRQRDRHRGHRRSARIHRR